MHRLKSSSLFHPTKKRRQFVNLVLDTCKKDGSFAMQRIKSSSLFHPKKQNDGHPLPPPSPPVEAVLPKPASSFLLGTPKEDGGDVMFMPFGSSRDKIVSADQDGMVVVHDLSQNTVSSKPMLEGWSFHSVPITVGDDLYLINRCPHGEPPAGVYDLPGWFWHSLPLPPYTKTPGYEPRGSTKIYSSAVVGDSIWVSVRGGIGTYAFDRGSREWSKVGSWELPFRDDAHFIPELDRWLGFSSGRENQFFCASDLSAAAAGGAASPTLSHVWKEDMATNPRDWDVMSSDLVRVDSGRFCIARLCHVWDESDDPFIKETFLVFTGVELERSDDTADAGIKMVKHKSIRYNIDGKVLHLVC